MRYLRKLVRNGCRERRCRRGIWMSLKSAGSAGEENCLAIAARLGWELFRLG